MVTIRFNTHTESTEYGAVLIGIITKVSDPSLGKLLNQRVIMLPNGNNRLGELQNKELQVWPGIHDWVTLRGGNETYMVISILKVCKV